MIASRQLAQRISAVLAVFGVFLLSLAAPAFALGEDMIAEEKRIRPDPVLMAEMKIIRDLTLDIHSLVTHRRLSPAAGRSFQDKIKGALGRIQAGTTLIGEPRDSLTAMVQDISAGAAAIAGKDPSTEPIDGIVLIDDALARYGTLFDDPEWEPLR
ncbi:MAG: hypothetical protein K2Y42_00600 [Hyphomicrobium sp.]|jgi:hypothetical protein|uniref:hypothetical protein n=1 Tax=Hyphomicrobium sp. TaxID=82 RepID=UPI0025BF9EFC|nr:hypothetical protein [Hyphomicrobium sp.]MBX9861224.1 hypothetical protein [Hyphomicrobium sp.]